MVVQKSVPVNLPTASTAKVDIQRQVPVTVMADNSIYVDDKKLDLNGMVRYLQVEQAKGQDLTIILRGDTNAQYGTFVQVLDTLKSMNLTKIAVATESKK